MVAFALASRRNSLANEQVDCAPNGGSSELCSNVDSVIRSIQCERVCPRDGDPGRLALFLRSAQFAIALGLVRATREASWSRSRVEWTRARTSPDSENRFHEIQAIESRIDDAVAALYELEDAETKLSNAITSGDYY